MMAPFLIGLALDAAIRGNPDEGSWLSFLIVAVPISLSIFVLLSSRRNQFRLSVVGLAVLLVVGALLCHDYSVSMDIAR